jgi:transcriptional adapter 2-alpha
LNVHSIFVSSHFIFLALRFPFVVLCSHSISFNVYCSDGLYHCDYCAKDLSTSLRIKCAVCPDFDLCLECFSVGAEIKPHSSDHAYRVVDNLSFPVFTLDWGADEEMLLLEGVETFGLGNWVKVAEHVGKHADDCRAHYFSVYVETTTFPAPQRSSEMDGVDIRKLIEDRRRAGAERIALARQQSAVAKRGRPVASTDKPKPSGGDAAGAAAQSSDVNIKTEDTGAAAGAGKVKQEGKQKNKKQQQQQQQHNVGSKLVTPLAGATSGNATPATSGFLPSAGGPALPGTTTATTAAGAVDGVQLIAPPSAEPGAPLMLSEAQQTGYHIKRNEFDPEYDHEAESIISELDFPEEESEEERAAKLRLIQIYNRRLDERARRYNFALSRGLVNVKRQSAIDRRRAPAERELLGRLRVIARYLPPQQWEALAENVAAEGRLRARIGQLQQYRAMGMRTFEEVETFEAIEAKKKKEVPPAAQAGKSRLQRIPVDETAMEAELASLGHVHAAAGVHSQHATIVDGRGPDGLQAWRTRRGVLLDIASLPDIEPLNAQERSLCANQRYLPAQYLCVKAEAMRIQDEKGSVSLDDMFKMPFKVSQGRTAELHEFFETAGWIVAPKSGKGNK